MNTTTDSPTKAIKSELKAVFPRVKFSVRIRHHSIITISWTDGPLESQVQKVANRYEMGEFDGMDDSYKYTNRRDDIPQVKYIFTSRDFSPQVIQKATEYTRETFSRFNYTNPEWEWEILRALRRVDLRYGFDGWTFCTVFEQPN